MVDKQGEGARGQPATSAWSVPQGRRTDEWSQCVVRIAEHRDRAAFGKFFSHFAPLISLCTFRFFAISSACRRARARGDAQGVAKGSGIQSGKGSGQHLGIHHCEKLSDRYVPASTEV